MSTLRELILFSKLFIFFVATVSNLLYSSIIVFLSCVRSCISSLALSIVFVPVNYSPLIEVGASWSIYLMVQVYPS